METERSAFEEDFVYIEEQKQPPPKREKLKFEEVKLPAANDQGFSTAFKNGVEDGVVQDQDEPLISEQQRRPQKAFKSTVNSEEASAISTIPTKKVNNSA